MSALKANYISADKENIYSLLYEDDAVEFIYEVWQQNIGSIHSTICLPGIR